MKQLPLVRLVTGVALATAAALAWSQAPAPQASPSAAAPAAADVPKPGCGDLPTEIPSRGAPDSRKRAFERQLRDYGTCIRTYVEERNAAIRTQQKAVQVYVDEYNKTLAAYQAEREAAKTQ